MNSSEILVSIAQVAAGGGIVQAILAFTRRRAELRQLDRHADSVAVATADQVIVILRTELAGAKEEIARNKKERAEIIKQINGLAEQIVALRTDLVVARAEIARLVATSGDH